MMLDNLVKEHVVPDVIDKAPSGRLVIKYSTNVEVNYGNELKPSQVKDKPAFEYDAKEDQLYALVMVDPDAPSRKEPTFREILHFMTANIPGNQVEKGETLAEYVGSGPPDKSGLHRYIFLLFEQKDGRLRSDMKIPNNSRKGRTNFSIKKFAKDNRLGHPIAANFYLAQYDDYVPTLHAQLSQG